MVASLSYPLGYLEWSNEPVVQLPGALQSQVPSAWQHLVTNCIINVASTSICVLLLGSLCAAQGGSYLVAQLYPIGNMLLSCFDVLHAVQTVNR